MFFVYMCRNGGAHKNKIEKISIFLQLSIKFIKLKKFSLNPNQFQLEPEHFNIFY